MNLNVRRVFAELVSPVLVVVGPAPSQVMVGRGPLPIIFRFRVVLESMVQPVCVLLAHPCRTGWFWPSLWPSVPSDNDICVAQGRGSLGVRLGALAQVLAPLPAHLVDEVWVTLAEFAEADRF